MLGMPAELARSFLLNIMAGIDTLVMVPSQLDAS